jgi:anti-sigma regulatory factor (Ser/Thr protein kinase)
VSGFVGDTLLNAPDPAPTLLRHEGIAYSGPAAFVPTATSILDQSVREGDACMLLADTSKLRAVRDATRDSLANVTFFDLSVHGRNPARVLPALQSFVDHHQPQQSRFIVEPVAAGMSAAARTEVEINELILRLPAYQQWGAAVCCLYDSATLDRPVTDALDGAHSADAPDAESALARRFAEALPPAPYGAKRAGADLTTLSELRRTIAQFCRTAGLGGERTDDFVYAVNEVVTNSICHGEGRARVLIWSDADQVWCEVHDRGRITDPLVGRIAPRAGQTTGRGLWLVNQMCDLVQVRSSGAGTFVRMSVEF